MLRSGGRGLQPVFSPHGNAQSVGGNDNQRGALLEKFPNCRDINTFTPEPGGARWPQRGERLTGFADQRTMLAGCGIGRLLRAQHEATADKSAGKEIQPQDESGEAETSDDEGGEQSGRRSVVNEDKHDRGDETEKAERAENQAGQEHLGGQQEKTDDKERDDEGGSVRHGQFPREGDGAGRPMKNALILSPMRVAVLVVVSHVRSPKRVV